MVEYFSGSNRFRDAYSLDIANNRWTRNSNMPKDLHDMTCAVHETDVFVIGGSSFEGGFDRYPIVYNLVTDEWRRGELS